MKRDEENLKARSGMGLATSDYTFFGRGLCGTEGRKEDAAHPYKSLCVGNAGGKSAGLNLKKVEKFEMILIFEKLNIGQIFINFFV
jgi:hypothetical protein